MCVLQMRQQQKCKIKSDGVGLSDKKILVADVFRQEIRQMPYSSLNQPPSKIWNTNNQNNKNSEITLNKYSMK